MPDQILPPKGAAKAGPHFFGRDHESDVPIFGLEGAKGRLNPGTVPAGDFSRVRMNGYGSFVEGHRAVVHGRVQVLPQARLVSHPQGEQDPIRCNHGGMQVHQGEAQELGGPVFFPDIVHESAHGLENDVEPRPVPIGPSERFPFSKSADRGINDGWIYLADGVVREPKLLHCSGAEILDNHIRLLHQGFENLLTLFLFKIKRQAFFVAVEAHESAAGFFSLLIQRKGREGAARVS